jgi:hypothetical protein
MFYFPIKRRAFGRAAATSACFFAFLVRRAFGIVTSARSEPTIGARFTIESTFRQVDFFRTAKRGEAIFQK